MSLKERARFTATSKCPTCGNKVMGAGQLCMECSREMARKKQEDERVAAAAAEYARTHIAIADLTLDPEMQFREKIREEAVAEYAQAMTNGAVFPPLVVVRDEKHNWLVDGFHRRLALLEIGAKDARVTFQSGTRQDAILFAAGANSKQGLRPTHSEKRKAMEALLRHPACSTWTTSQIAAHVGASRAAALRCVHDLEQRGVIEARDRSFKCASRTVLKLSPEEVKKQSESGKSYTQIADECGVSRTAVYRRAIGETTGTGVKTYPARAAVRFTPDSSARAAIRNWRIHLRTDAEIIQIVECLVKITGAWDVEKNAEVLA